MIIAKTWDRKFFEILRYGTVQFDDRKYWIIVRDPGDPKMTNIRWFYLGDLNIEWVRVFNFKDYAF